MSDPLADALAAIDGVEGWLSDGQARRLFDCASAVAPGGTIVEIGSFRGRSTIVLARAAAREVSVVAVDPHAGNDRGPQEIRRNEQQGETDRIAFEGNLARTGVADRIRHLRLPSSDALEEAPIAIDLLYVDGAHRYHPACSDLSGWGARVGPGGTMLIHDAFSSIGVTFAILRELLLSPHFVYVGRSRSLAEYRRASSALRRGQRAANGARQLAQLPWFARNLIIKLALVTRLRRLATLLGHPAGDEWPY